MKIIFVFVLFLMISSELFGQFRLKSDRSFKYHSDSLLLIAGIKHPNFNEVNFEFRFWIKDLSGNHANELFVLQHDKKHIWHSQHYQICVVGDKYNILSEADSIMLHWNDKWRKLLDNKILSLPDERNVRKKWRSSKGVVLSIADGTLYIFEFATEKARKRYDYSNPEENLKNYDLNASELVYVNNIIDNLETQFNFKEHFRGCR